MPFNILLGKKGLVSLHILLRNHVNTVTFMVNSRQNFKMITFILDASSVLTSVLVPFILFPFSFLPCLSSSSPKFPVIWFCSLASPNYSTKHPACFSSQVFPIQKLQKHFLLLPYSPQNSNSANSSIFGDHKLILWIHNKLRMDILTICSNVCIL